MEQKKKIFQMREDENTLTRWKNAAIDMRYMNFTQFVRDAIEEKIQRYENRRTNLSDS